MSDPNRIPVIEEIALDDLRIDPSYQRDPSDQQFLNMKKKIVGAYDPALLHPLDVSRWDNNNVGYPEPFVYDGYCRLESLRELRKLGFYGNKVRCAVIQVDHDEQSRLFLAQTSRRGVQWPDKHRARLAFNDPAAAAIEDVFTALGLKLGRGGDVRAVEACYSTVLIDQTAANPNAALRPDLLIEVLTVAGTAWTDDPNGALAPGLRVQYASSDRMIDALALLLSRFSSTEMPRHKLAHALHQVFPPVLVQKAAQKTSAHGSNNKGELAAQILGLYNRVNGSKLHKSRIITTARTRRTGRAASRRVKVGSTR